MTPPRLATIPVARPLQGRQVLDLFRRLTINSVPMAPASIGKPIIKFKHFWRMFGTIALHCGLKLHAPGPHLSGFEYIAGHPGYLGPRIEPMNTDIETKDHFVL